MSAFPLKADIRKFYKNAILFLNIGASRADHENKKGYTYLRCYMGDAPYWIDSVGLQVFFRWLNFHQ